MGEERDEAMRQQDATEAMIRMREPVRRPSEGPFMPCPAKERQITEGWQVSYQSEIVMPRTIPDGASEPGLTGAIRAMEMMLPEAGLMHRLTIIAPNGDSIDMALETNQHGCQIGDFNIVGPDGGMNIPPDVRTIMGLFLCLDFVGMGHVVQQGSSR